MSGTNANPHVFTASIRGHSDTVEGDGGEPEPIDSLEVFELIRHLNDPEHPLTLEQLRVVSPDGITVDDAQSTVDVLFTPTIPHCRCAHPAGCCF